VLSTAESKLHSGIKPWHQNNNELSCFLSSKTHLQIISPPTVVQQRSGAEHQLAQQAKPQFAGSGTAGDVGRGHSQRGQQKPDSGLSPRCGARAGKDPLLGEGHLQIRESKAREMSRTFLRLQTHVERGFSSSAHPEMSSSLPRTGCDQRAPAKQRAELPWPR